MLVPVAPQLPALLEAYRTGGGVAWERFGPDMREARADVNRPAAAAAPRSRIPPTGARPISHGCRRPPPASPISGAGAGWSSIGIAQALLQAVASGYDVDGRGWSSRRKHASGAGVGDGITFEVVDGADATLAGDHDLMIAIECVHGPARPVEFLASMERLAGPDDRSG